MATVQETSDVKARIWPQVSSGYFVWLLVSASFVIGLVITNFIC